MVRLYEKGNRRSLAEKSFADGKHGGKEDALSAAIKWRDEQMVIFRIKNYSRFAAPNAHNFHSKTKSGLTGVSLEYKEYQSGQTHVYWLAKVTIAGKPKTKYFSIRKHGYKTAWQLAVRFRAEQTGQDVDNEEPPMPDERLAEWAKEVMIKLL